MGRDMTRPRSRARSGAGLRRLTVSGASAAIAVAAVIAAAGALAAPASATQDPTRLIFPARPDVCGTGKGIVIRHAGGSMSYVSARRRWTGGDRHWREGDPPCETGVVIMEVSAGGVAPKLSVVSRERASALYDPESGTATWLTGQEAADRLLDDARQAAPEGRASRLVLAAMLAEDAVVWPALLELARDRSLDDRVRKSALHWLGRRAGDRATAALGGIVRDRTEADGIRDAAVFGLSRLPAERAVPALIEVVRTIDDPRVRSRSLFWLSEFDDPRVLALFEEILTAPEPSPGSGSG